MDIKNFVDRNVIFFLNLDGILYKKFFIFKYNDMIDYLDKFWLEKFFNVFGIKS